MQTLSHANLHQGPKKTRKQNLKSTKSQTIHNHFQTKNKNKNKRRENTKRKRRVRNENEQKPLENEVQSLIDSIKASDVYVTYLLPTFII